MITIYKSEVRKMATLLVLYFIYQIVARLVCVYLICKHPELSDKKVEYITKMMSKNFKKFS